MASRLDYSRQTPQGGSLALAALVCGCFSGPVGFAFALGAMRLSPSPTPMLALVVMAVTVVGACALGCAAVATVPRSARRNRAFAIAGMLAPIIWGIALFAAIAHAIGPSLKQL
jgi:hypothetical protein